MPVPDTGDIKAIEKCRLHHVLFSGDQLIAARTRGAQIICANSEDGVGSLEGLVPEAEDWHTKICLLGVHGIMQALYLFGHMLTSVIRRSIIQ